VSRQRVFWSFYIGGNRATREASDFAERGLDVFLVE
jgi:hypothetical protein